MVILVLGILGGMAWPTVLNQVARSKQARALHAIGAMSRAQHSFFHEHYDFSDSIDELGFNYLNQPGGDYRYEVRAPIDSRLTTIVADPGDRSLRGYTGVVFVDRDSAHNLTLASLVCEGEHHADPPQPRIETTAGQVKVEDCNPL
ncbi:MAG: type IV pilin-like G/H family protein [Cyanobacteriota bacterium]|nr:type IV pilin-like G/H family protein [Cyanobacteriota bacterium]